MHHEPVLLTQNPTTRCPHRRTTRIRLAPPMPLPPQQDELVKEQAVVYNKEDMLNPYFVVFGKRREGAVAPK